MHTFRLEPREDTVNRREWKNTDLTIACWVTGKNETDARQIVARLTIRPGFRPQFSPWATPAMTNCTRDSSPRHNAPPPGVVLTDDGHTFSEKKPGIFK